MWTKTTLGAIVVLGLATSAQAQLTDAQSCQTAKLSAVGQYFACRLSAERKAVLQGGPPYYSKCDTTLTRQWQKAETHFGAACPTLGDGSLRQGEARTDATELALWLSGTRPNCGDGMRTGSEQCDGADLGGASCAGLGYALGGTLRCTSVCELDTLPCVRRSPSTGQSTCWDANGAAMPCAGTGRDGDVQAGGPLSYVDNGDGTITDVNTGLMWEKKSYDGGIHDKNAGYSWDGAFAFAAMLNTTSFAGHSDWRVPNIKELTSIVDHEVASPGPTVAPAFDTGCALGCTVTTCSCTSNLYYVSSTSFQRIQFGEGYRLDVYFTTGDIQENFKGVPWGVRAVRGGS